MSSAATAALVSCGTLVVQTTLAGSVSGLQFRPAHQRNKSFPQPVVAASNSAIVEANLAEAALVTGKACSPPRTRGVTRTLAPAVSIAARKSKRRRGRPSGGSGDGGRGGGDWSDGWWWDDEDDEGPHKRLTEGLWLWHALCWLSLIQAVVWAVVAAGRIQTFKCSSFACATVGVNCKRPDQSYAAQPLTAAA